MAKENLISKGRKLAVDTAHGVIGGGFVVGASQLIENPSISHLLSPDVIQAVGTYGIVAGLSIATYEILVRGLLVDSKVVAFQFPNRRSKNA